MSNGSFSAASGVPDGTLNGEGKYRTIVADPPWDLPEARCRPWVMGAGGRRKRGTVVPYGFMELEAICDLPVQSLAHEDGCHLYLWVPAKFNRRGIGERVAEAWGFETVSEIVWDKINFGLGAFPRPQHEMLLVCRRGKLPFERRDVGSVQRWSVPRAKNNGGKIHSAKPDASIDLIEASSPGPYVELFARRARFGWDCWGNESLGTAEMVGASTVTDPPARSASNPESVS